MELKATNTGLAHLINHGDPNALRSFQRALADEGVPSYEKRYAQALLQQFNGSTIQTLLSRALISKDPEVKRTVDELLRLVEQNPS